MRPARRSTTPLLRRSLLSAALSVLSACGIAPTGVVGAGAAATGVRPTVQLYFVRDGALVVVPRTANGPVDAGNAVEMLLGGPTGPERLQGLTTELPRVPVEPQPPTPPPTRVPLVVDIRTHADTVTIELPRNLKSRLPHTAAYQLICTAAAAHLVSDPDIDAARVTLTGHTRTGRWRTEGSSTGCPRRTTPLGPSATPSALPGTVSGRPNRG
ncbi:GerMN domain-containing protein [Streptomyces actuosus]|uniref:GerMN domain-containing protein n=1 Tax=Streptomyces actuosus TaxID=1885 RepID=A0ABS2VZU3_STRAS|nr:GerMN domain-containing protein [Streptomyces actuosus]MBN0048501.1 GerMN domain-containing protein [Streptomyces actuosus]